MYKRSQTNYLSLALAACLALALLATPSVLLAQDGPFGLTSMVLGNDEIARVSIPQIDVENLLAQDLKTHSELRGHTPLRVAHAHPTFFSTKNAGTLEELGDGARLWRLRVEAPGAVFMAFGLSNIELPKGAELWAYSPLRASQVGPYRAHNNNGEKVLGTSVIAGDVAVLELYVPTGVALPDFVVERVSYGYRDFLNLASVPYRDGQIPTKANVPGLEIDTKALACEVDVQCPEGNGWGREKQSVARTFDGSFLCTGQLVANERQDCRWLFLTANHCTSRERTANQLTFFWNFERSGCGSGSAPTNQTTAGSTLLGTNKNSDYTLLELSEAPVNFDPYFAGFDATGGQPSSGTAIHHPNGDEKKISHEFDPVVDGQQSGWGNDHWRITGWDVGTTEGGSSGGGLWDENQRVVGQLHGGTADCSGGWDEYGKLSVSWGAGADSFLDPDGTGTLVVNGHEVNGCAPPPPPPSCGAKGDACSSGSDCCSGACKGNGTCR